MRLGKLECSPWFLLLMAWLHYADTQGIVLPALCACALHEMGHYGAILLVGGRVKRIRVTAVGAEMQLEGRMSYPGELAAALAGPGVNLALAFLLYRWEGMALFTGINLALGLFNLLPISRMDGGRALGCALSMLLGPQSAEKIGKVADGIFCCAALCIGVFLLGVGGNFTMLLVALWLNICGWEKEKGAGGLVRRGRKRYNKPYALFQGDTN